MSLSTHHKKRDLLGFSLKKKKYGYVYKPALSPASSPPHTAAPHHKRIAPSLVRQMQTQSKSFMWSQGEKGSKRSNVGESHGKLCHDRKEMCLSCFCTLTSVGWSKPSIKNEGKCTYKQLFFLILLNLLCKNNRKGAGEECGKSDWQANVIIWSDSMTL